MKFVLGIKPTIITDHGTTQHALSRVRQSIRGCFCYGLFGNAYVDNLYGDTIFYQVSDSERPCLKRMKTDGSNIELIEMGIFCNINILYSAS